MTAAGTFHGVGVGPGDPELLTLKAARLIAQSPVIAYLVNDQQESMAKRIAEQHVDANTVLLPIHVSMSAGHEKAEQAYARAAHEIDAHLRAGRNVAFLCLGDPLLYGSFIYLRAAMPDTTRINSVPGISSIQLAANLHTLPLSADDERIAIVTGNNSDAEILQALQSFDTVAILKAGRQRVRLLQLIKQAGREQHCVFAERLGEADERLIKDIRTLPDEAGSYFSLFICSRHHCG